MRSLQRLTFAAITLFALACGTRFPATSPEPRVGRVAPDRGPVAGGTVLLIEGLAFEPGAKVFFGETEATKVVFVSSLLLTAQAPAGEGPQKVTVVNPDGLRAELANGFTYVAAPEAPAPVIATVTPTSGPAAGGTLAELWGTGFEAGALVFVGGVPARDPVRVSGELVTAVLPKAEPGTADVAITNPDGQTALLAKGFAYNASYATPAPLVTGVLPQGGPVSGGIKGALTGANFSRGARVYIGGRPAPAVFQSETLLEVEIPEGRIGLASVGVTNPDGQSDYRPSSFSYYQPGPLVTLVAPDVGARTGGTEVTIIGGNYEADSVVTFGKKSATQVFVDNARTIRAIAPPGETWGPVDVGVKNRDGQEDVRSGVFYYFDADHPPPGSGGPLRVDRLLPSSGAASGGTSVMIVGSGFAQGTRVTFGSTEAAEVRFLSSGTLAVKTPAAAPGPSDVTVTHPDGATQKLRLGFTFFDATSTAAAPGIAGITPATGPATGGTRGLLAGRNFAPGAQLYFGDTKAARIAVVDASRITFVAPPHSPGLVDVVVVNPDGKSARLPLGYAFYAGEGAGPTVTEVAPPSAPAGRDAPVSITGAEFGAGAQVFVGDVPAAEVAVQSGAQLSATLPALAPGSYDITVTNADGRSGTREGAFSFTTPTPTLTRAVPAIGPVAGGVRVLLQGSSFLEGATVRFGSETSTDVLFVESGALLALAPANTAGKVDVVVTNPGGGGEARLPLAFEYREGYVPQPPPSIETAVPPAGPSSGGTVLALRGANFQPGMIVLFGGTAARRTYFSRPGEAVVVAPPGPVGAVDVTVVNPDGQMGVLSGGFRFVDPSSLGAAPVLTGIIPRTGPQSASTDLLLTGRKFNPGAMVFVGRHVAPFARRDSETLISSRAPAGQVGSVDVAVTNPDGQSSIFEAGFTYRAAPAIESVSPAESPDSGGGQVQVFGSAFEPGSRVYFGEEPARLTTFVGDTLLVAVVPAHTAGPVDVTVENPDGQEGVLEQSFVFHAAPKVSRVLPSSGPVTGGTIAAVVGTDFRPGARVLFDGVEVESGFGDEQTLAIKAPPGSFAGKQVTVTVVNVDGQRNDQLRAFTYTDPALFTTPDPTISQVLPARGPESGGTYAFVKGSHFVDGAIALFGNRLVSKTKVSFGTNLTGIVPGGPAGEVRVAVTNPDGRSAELAPGFRFIADDEAGPAPTVATIDPQKGITRGGEDVSVGGANFSTGEGGLVLLAGFPAANVEALSSGSLKVTTGPGVIGAGDVVVTNADGRSGALANSWLYEATAPSFAATTPLAPASGPTRGDTLVTITGNDFEFGAEVRFGTALAPYVLFVSPTTLKARTPPGPIGKVDVAVVNPGGKIGLLAQGYEFVPPPLILSVTPSSGPRAGGNAIFINGRYFRGTPSAPKVFVGQSEALSVKLETDSVITAVTPPGSGTAVVKVVNGDGQPGELPAGYVYLATIQPPDIVAVSPDNGESGGGTYVTIVGSGFTAGAKVFFGDSEADQVQVMSGGAITCRTPAGLENARVPVTVKNPPHPGGTEVTKAGAFLYRPGLSLGELSLTFVSPLQGPCAGGTEILIGGQGIKTGAKVYLDGVEQDDVRVYGPTSIAARTKSFGDPASCPPTPVEVKVQNPTLEFAILRGGFTYTGGNRRFSVADGDRLPAESWDDKTDPLGVMPVVARLSGATGGGAQLADILFGRTRTSGTSVHSRYGNFLYYTPKFQLGTGVLWSEAFANLRKYDGGCGTKVRAIDRNCSNNAVENTSNSMVDPIVADFDLNSWPDVLFFDRTSNKLVVVYNDAGVLTRYELGSFPTNTSSNTSFCSATGVCATGAWAGHAVANVDLDPAGKPDVVIVTAGIDFVLRNETSPTDTGRLSWTVLPPRGATSFMLYQNNAIPTGDDSRGVSAADVDGDGDVDVMVGGWNIPVKTYLSDLNNLTGTLESRQAAFRMRDAAGAPFGTSTAWSGRMRDLKLADFDKDGRPDLLVTHERQQDEIWRNTGAGTFVNETFVSGKCGSGRRLPPQTTSAVFHNEARDVDADGDLDLLQWLDSTCSSCSVPRRLRLYRNDAQTDAPAKAGCFVDATDEFFPRDGADGAPDLSPNMGFGDLDGDGYPDAVFAGESGRQNRVYMNVQEGGKRVFRDRTRIRLPNRWDRYTFAAEFADVDGDQDQDLILSTATNDLNSSVSNETSYRATNEARLRLYLNDGSGHFTDATDRLPDRPLLASRIAVGDVNGDGRVDILVPNFVEWRSSGVAGEYRLYMNDGTGRFKDESFPRLPTGEPSEDMYGRAALLADLDRDGDLDIAAGANECLRVWLNTGGGYFTDVTATAASFMPNVATCQGGYYYYSPGSYTSMHVREILASDFDFNGTQDLFVVREQSNLLLLNCLDADGRPVFQSGPKVGSCAPPNAPAIPSGGGYAATLLKRKDGDVTVTDVALYQDSTSKVRLWRGSRVSPGRLGDDTNVFLPTGLSSATNHREMGNLFATPDYDRDGDRDLVYVVSNTVAGGPPNRVLRNSGTFTDVLREPAPFDAMPTFGDDDGRGIATADVDGDGFDDILVLNVWNPRLLLSRP